MNCLFTAALTLTIGLPALPPAQAAPRLLAMHLISEPAPTPTYRLVGRVFGPTGRPQPGATLTLKNTTTVVSTDATGHFALDLPTQGANVLVAGYIGCDDMLLPLTTAQNALIVHLRPSLNRALRIGDFAPDFDLPTTAGANFRLSEHRGHPVVLYFYPKDGSPGCTKEACSFRDQYKEFEALGAEVIGISSDNAFSHQAFAGKLGLPFPLLSDAGGELRKRYAVPRAVLGLLPGRVTYVLDGEGRVKYVFNSLNDATDHVLNAKAILHDLH